MSFDILDVYARDRFVWLGDSIFAYGCFQPLQDAITAYYTNLYGVGSPEIPVHLNAGVVADTAALVDARERTIDDFCPSIIIDEPVLNDCSGATDNTSFTNSCTSILNKQKSHWPNARIAWMGPFGWQENWPSGANPYDKTVTGIEAKDAILRQLAAQFGIAYIAMREIFTTREPIDNPGHAVSGIYLVDGVHPTLSPGAGTPGQTLFSNAIGSHFRFNPQRFPIARTWQTP